jgi:hypothetical protein
MGDFILLMHGDEAGPQTGWGPYFARLRDLGVFRGGSAIGEGGAFRREGPAGPAADHLTGFIRVEADSLEAARALLAGNPVYEAGGTVEIRALPTDEGA